MEMKPSGALLALLLALVLCAPFSRSEAQPLNIYNSLDPYPIDSHSREVGIIDIETLDASEQPVALKKYLRALETSSTPEERNLLSLGIAVLYRNMGDPERALQVLQRDIAGNFILQDHRLDERARGLMGLAQGDFAEKNFASARNRVDESIEIRFELLRSYPDSPFSSTIARDVAWAEWFLGNIHFQAGHYKLAWQAYRRALTREFDGNDEHRLQVNLALAETYEAAGELKDAADIYGYLQKEDDSPAIRAEAERFFEDRAADLKALSAGPAMPEPTEPEVKFSDPRVKKPHAVKEELLSPRNEALSQFYEAFAESDLPLVLDRGYEVLKNSPGNDETQQMREPLNRQIIIYLRARPWDDRVERIVALYPVGELNRMGHRLWGSGLSTHAARIFEIILERHPLDIEECHKSLFFLGRIWEDKGNFPRAIDYYRRLAREYDFGVYTTDALFKIPWIERLQGRHAEAKEDFEALLEYYNSSAFKKVQQAYPSADTYRSATLFWLGETEAALGNAEAQAQHQRILTEEFPFNFYGIYSHEIRGLDIRQFLTRQEGQDLAERKFGLGEVERKRLRRAESLIAAGLPGRARFELNLLEKGRDNPAYMFYLTRLLERAGAFQKAMRLSWTIARRHNNLDRLSQDLSESLFPQAYLEKVRKAATKHDLDPLLVISLIRQESAFDPEVISTANAIGLMQLLPGTAAHVARTRQARAPTAEELQNPATNIELGTDYLNSLLETFDGNFVHALAAYNAGPRKVKSWLRIRADLGPLEFIESIPYNETRNYVKQILRNYAIYQALYKNGSARALIKDLLTKPGD